jgi:hypothetical protein
MTERFGSDALGCATETKQTSLIYTTGEIATIHGKQSAGYEAGSV